ncbi:MAG: ABC transporter substrate-binding protein [Eubacterium sp.]|nr:ABC transporter substrate-binding protein [Eubacterium sp.]
MRKSVTYFTSCLVSGLLVLGLAGCGSGSAGTSDTGVSASASASVNGSSADGLTEVTLGMVPWPAFELFYLAEDQGIFEKNGLKVKIREFSSTTDNSMAFVGGKLDFCTYPSGESISPYAENKGFQVIMPMDKSNGCEGLIATLDIKSIKDLKGKTVASQFSSVDHYLLLTLLKQNGMSADDINFVDMSIEEAGSSFVAGQCDAASI